MVEQCVAFLHFIWFSFQIFWNAHIYFKLQNKADIKNKKQKPHKNLIPKNTKLKKKCLGFRVIPINNIVKLAFLFTVFTQCNKCASKVLWEAKC